jgi:hypothetical protein
MTNNSRLFISDSQVTDEVMMIFFIIILAEPMLNNIHGEKETIVVRALAFNPTKTYCIFYSIDSPLMH